MLTAPQLMIGQLLEHPDDDTLALALTDALVEEENESPERAVARVDGYRIIGHQNRRFARVRKMFENGGPRINEVQRVIAWHAHVGSGIQLQLVIEPGANRPQVRTDVTEVGGEKYPEGVVVVGADWILAILEPTADT